MGDESLDYLTTEDLLEIAAGVIGDATVCDEGLLASAAGRPIPARSATKRIRRSPGSRGADAFHSRATMLWSTATSGWPGPPPVFCLLNGRDLTLDVDEAEALGQAVAAGELETSEIAIVIEEHLS